MRTLSTLLLSVSITLLASCSSDSNISESGDPLPSNDLAINDPQNCSVESLNAWVDFNMRDYYYFADQVPVVNLADYESPEELILDLLRHHYSTQQ